MPYLIQKGEAYLERDSTGGPLRWGPLKHATRFSLVAAKRIAKRLSKFESGVIVTYIA